MVISDIELNHFNNPPKCLVCGKQMISCYDNKLKRKSGFIWSCKCMPKGIRMLLA